MPSCAFRKCSNNSRNTSKANGITFHSFPTDPHYKEIWIKVIQEDQRDDEWLPSPFTRVCSAHFKEKDFKLTPLGRRKIKVNAIPVLRPNLDSSQDLNIEEDEQTESSLPLELVYVSDSESIFDSPKEIHLKKKLDIETRKRQKCRREILKLRRQNKYLKLRNKYLKSRNKSLLELVKCLKRKIYFNKEENDVSQS